MAFFLPRYDQYNPAFSSRWVDKFDKNGPRMYHIDSMYVSPVGRCSHPLLISPASDFPKKEAAPGRLDSVNRVLREVNPTPSPS